MDDVSIASSTAGVAYTVAAAVVKRSACNVCGRSTARALIIQDGRWPSQLHQQVVSSHKYIVGAPTAGSLRRAESDININERAACTAGGSTMTVR